MISSISIRWRWLRRKLSRTHWTARLLGIPLPKGEVDEPGLLIIQIDGLSRVQLEKALAEGSMPFLASMIRRNHFSLETFYSGVPSTTPAVQAEIFYGVRAAVPAFQFLDRKSGKMLRMFEAESVARIEAELAQTGADPLLKDGHAYSNIYRAGAVRSRYCSQDLAPDEIIKRLHPLKNLLLAIAYFPRLLRILGLGLLEFGLALMDAIKGLFTRENAWMELCFVPARVVVCIIVRELIRFRVLLDLERCTRVIHANFLGYDEQAHRRGPASAFAHWSLKGIDRTIADFYRAAQGVSHRDYELIVYSDHGQQKCMPYEQKFGRQLGAALQEVFTNGPLAEFPVWSRQAPQLVGATVDRCRAFFKLEPLNEASAAEPDPAQHIIVAAMGPLGHLYLPRTLSIEELANYARAMVRDAGIPLVLIKDGNGGVSAFHRDGEGDLIEHRAALLGENHPLLDEVAGDLIALCHRENAGDIVISGWTPHDTPLTFPLENGAHAGPGPEETCGFLLLSDRIRHWHVSHFTGTRKRVRGEDLRHIALHYLGRDGKREERVAVHGERNQEIPLRIITYNIHSCRGIDGKLRPERIARVINHFEPDIVAVQEVDSHRARSGGFDQAHVIADHLRMNHVFHAMLEEEKERYGIAIFSRYPFEIVKSGLLTEANPKKFQEARGAIWVKVRIGNHPPFHFFNTHFGLGRGERHLQITQLLGPDWLGAVPSNEPVILCGDFNSGPRSAVYRKLTTALRDVQRAGKHVPFNTFSSIAPLLRIDHVWVSPHFTVEGVERADTPTAIVASDHLPMCVQLGMKP